MIDNDNDFNLNDIMKQLDCYFLKCNVEFKEVKVLKEKVRNATKIIIEIYKKGELTKKEFITNMIKIREIQLNSDIYTKFINCGLENCYDVHKKLCDNLLRILSNYNVKYKKPAKYTLTDYKKIMLLYLKQIEILPIANKKTLN